MIFEVSNVSNAIIEYLRAKDEDPSARVTTPEIKLTQAVIDGLPTKPYDYQIREATISGLRVRVRKNSGRKIFEISRKVNGRTATALICHSGQAPYSKGDESVLVRARSMLAEMDKGVTPSKKKTEKRAVAVAESRNVLTVKQACDNYIGAKDRAYNTSRNYERFRDNHLADWHGKQLAQVSEDDIEELFDTISDKTGPVAANNVIRFFRAVWKHHRRKYNLGDSPTIIFTEEGDSVKSWNAENRRTRYVHRNELGPWWRATERLRTDYIGDGDLAADFLQFAMLTGLRRREITRLKWQDINRRRKTFAIAENKSKRPHIVPLTEALEAILDRREGQSRPFAIEEPKRFITQVTHWCEVPFSSHDLRRTYLTHATDAGVPLPVLKSLVNHSRKSDVTDGYIQIDEDLMRSSMETIQSFILTHAGQVAKVSPIGGSKYAN